jgi:hypothetical protein
MLPRESFCIYLEGSGPGIRAERFRREVGEDSFAVARERWSGRVLGQTIERAAVEAALGPPDEEGGSALMYRLPLRPGYAYSFFFDPARGLLLNAGYRRLGPAPDPPPRPRDEAEAAAYRARLAQIGATESEILEWLGTPIDRSGWWPIETWEYPGGLALNLRHGVVEEREHTISSDSALTSSSSTKPSANSSKHMS